MTRFSDEFVRNGFLKALNLVEQAGYTVEQIEPGGEFHLFYDPGHPTEPEFIGIFDREPGDPGRWYFFGDAGVITR